jgi:uncharacterized repeat protein (TIGR01451 family)
MLTVNRLVAAAAGLVAAVLVVPAGDAAAAPRRADLTVTAVAEPATVSTAGGRSVLRVDVRNDGNAPAADARVLVTLPAGAGLAVDSASFDEWTCDVSQPRLLRCGRSALAASTAAETLTFPVAVAPGRDGDRLTFAAVVATATSESTTRNNTATATVRRATPVPPDLSVALTAVPAEVVVGDRVELRVRVRNVGAGSATGAYVNVPLADGLDFVSPSGTDGWDCNFGTDLETGIRSWGCAYYGGAIAPGDSALPLHLFATLTSGTSGSTLSFSATARDLEGEPVLGNNVATTTVAVVEPATVRGTVWADHDGDGQRSAAESGTGYALSVFLLPVAPGDGEPQEIPVTVESDGTYAAAVKPGAYRLQVRLENFVWADFTVADAGDDATDSDIVAVDHQAYLVVGDSAVLDLAGGTTTVVDAGARYAG